MKNITKFVLSMVVANIIRLFRFIPNNDPVMAMMLPYSKNESKVKAFVFPFLTIISFDFLTGFLGTWTIITSLTYGGLGLLFAYIYKKLEQKHKKIGLSTYFFSGIVGVLIFDFITGVLASPFIFGMTFEQAFLGQIPFTLLHLVTVSGYILVITPLLDRHILMNPKLDDKLLINYFKIKIGLEV